MRKGGGRHQPGPFPALLTLAVLMLWVGTASSQVVGIPPATTADPPSPPVVLCRSSLPCLQHMVDDLREHRQYLEDQLALAKSLLLQANQRISQQATEIQSLRGSAEAGETKGLPK